MNGMGALSEQRKGRGESMVSRLCDSSGAAPLECRRLGATLWQGSLQRGGLKRGEGDVALLHHSAHA
jgi:hypothetical protein